MKLYNTLTAKKEEFVSLEEGKIKMYLCGPTVYDFGHLGHGRSAVAFDVIRRFFIRKGFDVTFVSNFTDIDDKMITRAEIAKTTVPELAEKIIPEYEKDYGRLNILTPDVQPRATDYIAEIIEIVTKLEERGIAYKTFDGVYYDVTKFKGYGKLSKQDLDQLKSGIRVEVNDEKKNPHDFVLWKFYKEGEPFWESPWGKGRPGWHIECSAMNWKILGETFDIHAGGADLIFPHHECEIAQSEAAFDKPFARYWLHNGFIEVNKEKMSKSLGNFFTLRDIFKEFNPLAVRFFFLQTHYRAPIEYSLENLKQAGNGLERIYDFTRRLGVYKVDEGFKKGGLEDFINRQIESFDEAMSDDFETPRALATFFDLIKEVNKRMDTKQISALEIDSVRKAIKDMDSVFKILPEEESITDDVIALIKEREDARRNKDFKKSDEIRDDLLKQGFVLEDNPDGTIWKKVH
jgi:cysteinyl-tRNA synthetase